MCKAENVVKWFADNGVKLDNSLSGNIKINKLLVFSQLMNLVENDKKLFDEDIYAFKNGLVVEDIRLKYKNYRTFTKELENAEYNFKESELYILQKVNKIFSHLSSKILSDLTHQFKFWKDYYEFSIKDNYYYKEESKIRIEDVLKTYKNDIDKNRTLLAVNEDEEFIPIQIQDTTFYYDPLETKIEENVVTALKDYPATEKIYSFYFDESQGLIVY